MTDISRLTDDELARRAYVEMDPLTSTDLERELLTRFEKLAGITEQLDAAEIDLNDLPDVAACFERFGHRTAADAEMLDTLEANSIFTDSALRAALYD